MTEEETLNWIKDFWKQEAELHSDAGKPERERLAVGEFLEYLEIPFEKTNLQSPPQNDAADVKIHGADFQVKEIMNPNEKRQGDIGRMARFVSQATRAEDLSRAPTSIYDTPPLVDTYKLMAKLAEDMANGKYISAKTTTDLLFYVTRRGASLPISWDPDSYDLSKLGWRSISCLIAQFSVVLYASPAAPEFLRERVFKKTATVTGGPGMA
jgi:hypothetical protein